MGAIPAGGNAEVRFYVSKFKGTLYAHVRKHVSTATYTGPTPDGVALTREAMQALHQALAPLELASPGEERELARVAQSPGRTFVARLSLYKEKAGVDLRTWVESAGYVGWSRKGVRIPYDHLPEIKRYLSQMEVFFRAPLAAS